MSVNVTEHQRPGVYSAYDASSVVSGRAGGGNAAVAAVCSKGTAGQVYDLTSPQQAEAAFGAGESLTELCRLLFLNGAAKVYAVPVEAEEDYEAAFAALEKVEDVAVVVCSSTDLTVQQDLRDSVKRASESRRERLAVVGGDEDETAEELVARAGELNCERVILVPGGEKAAAAVAGAVVGESDPAVPLGGAELSGLTTLEEDWDDNALDSLILGGVTPLERAGGAVSVVRGVTTRTKTGSAKDTTWRELTTIRVVDDVIPALRGALRAKFSRAKNTTQGREAIRSQVIVELEQKVRDEIISGYEGVTASALESDPTVCLVEFRFSVAHGLNQIWVSAHITV